ncbi:hypothetical protein HSBAA_56440 [Vreelandella sulfidaeris]|uniref:Uncharacterized protein n=1 Tax=Vreelandella sulfidaeris TaxID=115553 RepID=A0A455UJ06_9GAMM|nr:hypothetical protein HSBAA_56440 [Halomonas sulfidaeris]
MICEDQKHRDELLRVTNEQSVMTRPIWQLMNSLPMYAHAPAGELSNSRWLEERVVNLPSSLSPPMGKAYA